MARHATLSRTKCIDLFVGVAFQQRRSTDEKSRLESRSQKSSQKAIDVLEIRTE
jgi:hypothetical protein